MATHHRADVGGIDEFVEEQIVLHAWDAVQGVNFEGTEGFDS